MTYINPALWFIETADQLLKLRLTPGIYNLETKQNTSPVKTERQSVNSNNRRLGVMWLLLQDFHNRKEFIAILDTKEEADILADQLLRETDGYSPGVYVIYSLREEFRFS